MRLSVTRRYRSIGTSYFHLLAEYKPKQDQER